MEFEPSNIYDPNGNPIGTARKKKRSPATGIAVISLILSIALLIALGKTISFFKEENQRLTEEYEQKLDELKNDGLQNSSDDSQEDQQPTQIVIDETSYALSTVVSAVRPSVVCVCVTVPSQTIDYGFTHYQTEAATSTGSGIIWSKDGYIITNQHVVEYAQQYDSAYITILFDDGTEADATLIAADKQTDLALVKVEPESPLPKISIGSSSALVVGESAIAVGNPLGIEYANSVTVGIISGLDRKVTGENGVSTMIQTDAAVNPGNSGGALVDASGKLIGVVSAKISSTDVEGIGFAIPIDDAIKIVTSLKEYGYIKDRPATGIAEGTEITASMARRYRLPQGFYVTQITAGSGAELAGIQKYDVILTFDGQEVSTLNEIEEIKKTHKVGDAIPIHFYQYRTGKTVETTLTLTEDKG